MAEHIDARNLREVRKELMTCTYCGFCKSVCPTFEGVGWDTSVARGRMVLSYGLLQKDISADDSVVEAIFQCTTCKDCERRCPSKVRVVDVVERARKDLVSAGKILPRHKGIVDNVLAHGNPYGERKGVRETLGNGDGKAEIGYFAGCTAAYRNPGIAKATMSILDKLNVDFAVVDELCCGSVLQRIGWNEDDVNDIMQRNVDAIKERGVREVLLSCAGCYRMFKEEYPRFVDVPFKVRHISEFLAEKELPLKESHDVITYHDPCHLGRHSNVYEAPRKVILKIPGASFQEMPRSGDTSRCCGGGGGVRSAYPDLSSKIAARRVDEAAFADTLVTACPFCVNNLNVGMEGSTSNARVVDIVELVDELL